MANITHKILLVDDDVEIRDTLKALLETEDYEVQVCSTAAEAERMLKAKTFSVILLDIFLKDRNGIDFINDIRNLNIQTPIVIITGSTELELARKALRLGVFDYLVKPFRQGQLQQVVRNAVIKNGLLEEARALEEQKRLYQDELERMVQQKMQELQQSQVKYKNLVDQSLVGVFVIKDGMFSYVNKRFCELMECSSKELLENGKLLDFIHPEDRPAMQEYLLKQSGHEASASAYQCRLITKQDTQRIVKLWLGKTALDTPQNTEYQGIMIDATVEHEAKNREAHLQLQLMNEHKLAAIGQLAAGISHNLNTPIAIIQANAELLKLTHPKIKEAEKILQQTKRMSQLINTILDKGRKEQNTSMMFVDLNDLLKQELEFLNANLFFKHQIEKEYHFDPNIPKIKAVYSDFSQGISNIIQNAIDALFDAPQRKMSISTEWTGQKILVKIADSGPGIPEHLRDKIFDPFFTTKPTQTEQDAVSDIPHGTGLGLSSAYNLLTPYGVKIDLESKEGQGTTFVLSIPAKKEE